MADFERHSMRLFPSPLVSSALAVGLAGLLMTTAAPAEESSDGSRVAASSMTQSLEQWRQRAGEMENIRDRYERIQLAAQVARAVESAGDSSEAQRMAAQVDRVVLGACQRLGEYPQLQRVHGHEEPTWLDDRGDVTAQAVLALCALERWNSDLERRERLKKLAYGLASLQRKDRQEYPFGAHLSWRDLAPLARLGDDTRVPAAYFQTGRAYAVKALAEASQVLEENDFLLSAEREALGMSTHLVIAGRLVESFSPSPEWASDGSAAEPLVEGFLALHKVTGKPVYADLAALATRFDRSPKGTRWNGLKDTISTTSGAPLLKARPLDNPNTFQVMEAEKGKVVNKAIETLGFASPSGQEGELATMGRENTFWMRFDVPREDEYLFYLDYLQSDVGGGLVSVMMRIDGDKIFQVPLGDVDGLPILRRKFVDGPRPLRAGPHSFGIRFSGLLMTKPALLDSVIVQPAIERREFQLENGERLVLLRNVTREEVGTDIAGFSSWPPTQAMVVNGDGLPAKMGSEEDRRRRRKFTTLPAYGVALLRFSEAK